jgi:hypothetical protein
MTSAESGFVVFRGPVDHSPGDRRVFAPGVAAWTRVEATLRGACRTVVALPDRGARPAADLPPEFFRFPPF